MPANVKSQRERIDFVDLFLNPLTTLGSFSSLVTFYTQLTNKVWLDYISKNYQSQHNFVLFQEHQRASEQKPYGTFFQAGVFVIPRLEIRGRLSRGTTFLQLIFVFLNYLYLPRLQTLQTLCRTPQYFIFYQ